MQLHGPKRVYTRDSLDFWFGKLELEWDDFFLEPHLAAGRALYRTGGIREIELNGAEAIVHCRVEKKDEYSVIEWKDDALHVRSSNPDKVLGNTIAVAGLHEIEELLADEIAELLTESVDGDGTGNGRGDGRRNGRSGADLLTHAVRSADPLDIHAPAAVRLREATDAGPKPTERVRAPRSRREILLKLRIEAGGLLCEPWWCDKDGPSVRAIASNGNSNGQENGNGNGGHAAASAPSASERMKLISLTALAKKSHFRFNAELGGFLLESLGEIPHFVETVLPAWRRQFRIDMDVAVERLGRGVRTVQVEARARRVSTNTIDLEWIFKSGKQLIDAGQLGALDEAGGEPVMIPSVGLVSLAPESLRTLRQWRESTANLPPQKLPAYLLFSLFNDQRCKLTLTPELEAWRDKMLKAGPKSLATSEVLRRYQRLGVDWLAHLCDHGCHGLLADEMGLGKTLQVISLLKVRSITRKTHLVVCPASVVPVWQEEFRRFYPEMDIFVLKNGHDFRHEKSGGVWLASYAQLRNHRTLLAKQRFGYAILDEGQFIKNPDAKITNTCFEIRAKHRLVLTGTPLENRQLDLWSIFNYLLPGLLGTRSSFETMLAQDHDGTIERLRTQLAPFVLRRTKAQVAKELPPKVEIDLLCPLSDLQRREYARVCREGLDRLGDDITQAMREKSFGFLSLLTRLRQVCCDPDLLPWLDADTTHSGKLNLLVERIAEVVSSGHKVVIFSQFVMFLKRAEAVLRERFPDVPRFELTGSTLDRQKPVQDFQNCPTGAFMLVSLKAAGTGITLHAADYVFLLDPWWNPSVEDQAVDRVHRIGQTRTVFVYRLVTRGTVEERIQALKAEKKQLFERIMGDAAGDLELSEHFNSLHQLIELGSEAPEPESNEDGEG